MRVYNCNNARPEAKPKPVYLTWDQMIENEGVYKYLHNKYSHEYTLIVLRDNTNRPNPVVLYVDSSSLSLASRNCWNTGRREFYKVDAKICMDIQIEELL